MDQLESPLPGFLSKLKGRLKNQKHISATVLLDHFSSLNYIHIQSKLTSEESLNSKQAFEASSLKQEAMIRHYYVDNRIFANNTFIESVDT